MSPEPHNPGTKLDLAWLEQVNINLPAVLRSDKDIFTINLINCLRASEIFVLSDEQVLWELAELSSSNGKQPGY